MGSLCRKCGDTWHVVVAMKGQEVAQVECKQCGGRHKYRSAEAGATSAGTRRAVPAGTAARKRAAAKTADVVVEPDLTRPVRDYQTSETFGPGDRVAHPRFGTGVVQRATGPTKVEIHFADGPKVLVHGRG